MIRFIDRYLEIVPRRVPAIVEHMKNGSIATMDPEKMLFLIIGAVHGAILWWIRKGCSTTLTDEADIISSFVLNGVIPAKTVEGTALPGSTSGGAIS